MSEVNYTLRILPENVGLVINVPQQETISRETVGAEGMAAALFSGFRGEKGEPGERGERGERGEPGIGGTVRVDFPSNSVWELNHNLGCYPSISAYTSGGVSILGTVVHLNTNQVQISFDEPIAGFVTFSY